MRRIGVRYYDSLLNEDSFIEMHEGGMNTTEIDLVHNPMDLDFKNVRKLADKYGIHIWSTHLPMRDQYTVVQETAELRAEAVRLNAELIKRGTDIGCDKFVIHPSFIIPQDADRAECIEYSKEALDTLCEIADKLGAKLAVENMIPSCLGRTADELLDIVSVNDKLGICFDVNHLLMDNHNDFADKVKSRLITMHISDYDFVKERHWFPGEGKIDWVALYKKICEIGYEGDWIYELSPGTINDFRSRPLTVRDFYNNAMEIFSGKAPSRI